jgi:hypothetical protein
VDPSHLIANFGAFLTMGLGLLGLFAPAKVADFTSLSPAGLNGKSEIRATYGGLFTAMGVSCLATQAEGVFLTVGVAWIGAAIGRSWSVVVDRNFSSKNLGGVAFECSIGLLLTAPVWSPR